MAITDWPLHERPREKLLHAGADTLSDAELLAIFIRNGIKGKTALDIARSLLNDYGGLRKIFQTKLTQFIEHPGLGTSKFVQLHAALELGKRYFAEKISDKDILTNSIQVKQFVAAKLRDHPNEVFACLFLDTQNKIICFEEIFVGTLDSTHVYPRELIKRAIAHNAAGLVLAHNHPSGLATPSKIDIQITKRLKQSLALVDIHILDHLIVGDHEVVSLAERGEI